MAESAPPDATRAAGPDPAQMVEALRADARALGFSALGISGTDLTPDAARVQRWLELGRQGEMAWMARHGAARYEPATLVPGTLRVVSVRLDYWPGTAAAAEDVLATPGLAYVSRYALGRDYHRLMRLRLKALAERLAARAGPFGYRAFVDSGPVLEKPVARNAGLGWIGKHTNLIDKDRGSWFFLGELYTDLPLPVDAPAEAHCGSCSACLAACPTGAIVAPFELDARLCISYLTIELKGAIPEALRAPIGNRIYGCDDCQLVCPWNKFARASREAGFEPRHGLDSAQLTALMAWTEAEFDERLAGSPIRRIGFSRWRRNLAVALGNGPDSGTARAALAAAAGGADPLVREHAGWALAALERRAQASR